MTLVALHGFCIGPGRDVFAGDVFEAPEHLARYWIASGHAAAYTPPAVVAESAAPEAPAPAADAIAIEPPKPAKAEASTLRSG